MADDITLNQLWYKLSGVEFGYYDPAEVRTTSVREITNPIAFDSNKAPQAFGLYDPVLGVSPNDRSAVCVTCGHTGLECSGHIGHIELLIPTYNPMLVDKLLQLIRLKCLSCHKFRIRTHILQLYKTAFALVKKGLLNEAKEYLTLNYHHNAKKLERLTLQKNKSTEQKATKEGSQENGDDDLKMQMISDSIACIKKRRAEIRQLMKNTPAAPETNAGLLLFGELVKDFFKQGQQKCPHCATNYSGIKREGASKFFLLVHEPKEQESTRKKSSSTTRGENSVAESSVMADESQIGMASEDPQSQSVLSTIKKELKDLKEAKHKKQRFMSSKEIYNEMRNLWREEQDVLKYLYGNGSTCNNFNMFFLNVIIVPPNRFRPESKMGEEKYLHDHTTILTNIIKANKEVKHMIITESLELGPGQSTRQKQYKEKNALSMLEIKKTEWYNQALRKLITKTDFINKCLQLQDSVNCFLDATKASKMADREFKGLRQILEKKEGLFRMKMMGKRVNYAARSVISPDPSLQTDEVGLPIFMAKKLTFPEPVNEYSVQRLKQYIINGKEYPGANYLEENGKLIRLDLLTEQQRISHARNLLINAETKIVYRHLMTGDNVLFNRQPTLHKPGLMAHRIRVLPREQTLRMNYANCKSYNADFDGDEMNLHALQNYPAKAEAELCITDKIYTNPTNGKPIRELIQDSIISSVYLTLRDTFLKKSEYTELLYQSTFSLFEKKPRNMRLMVLKPTIIKPQQLWTGKQLISNIMKLIVSLSNHKFKDKKGLTMKAPAKISKEYLRSAKQDAEVLIVDNELLKGIVDKNQIGSGSDYGIVHSFNELYGQKLTGQLMTCLTKLFSSYLQMHGFTCGLDDLMLNKKTDNMRKTEVESAHHETVQQVAKYLNVTEEVPKIDYVARSNYQCDDNGNYTQEANKAHIDPDHQLVQAIRKKITNQPNGIEDIEDEYKHAMSKKISDITKNCLQGFIKRFPYNNFSMMTVTGAKGSNVNHSQVSVMLGQQELEGKRVPLMISGKSLPSFIAFDPNPRASGFISDRFLTGLREQEFFFHCMAGREGLIDTAVKTSRSGYLQRCLMKHLETLKIEYDYTVRDADGSVVQFYYGEDSIDPSKQKFLEKFDFLNRNSKSFKVKYQLEDFKPLLKTKQIREFKKLESSDTIMNRFHIGANLGSMSEKCYASMNNYISTLPKEDKKQFEQLYQLKFLHTLAQPGESVGCTAAQAVGEPSTQMTLNTFHLAGHGGVNLTLGIPRLREILMTSTDKLKTPIMELYFKKPVNKDEANYFAQQLQKVKLLSLVHSIEVVESKHLIESGKLLPPNARKRIYHVKMVFEDFGFIEREFGLTRAQIKQNVENKFMYTLLHHVDRVNKKSELKPEIKRTHKQDREQEDDQEQVYESVEKGAMEVEEDRHKTVYDSEYFGFLDFDEQSCDFEIKVPLSLKKFLMTKVVEKLLGQTILREVKDINRAIVIADKDNKKFHIQTEGVNFRAVQDLDFINHNNIASNDIQAICRMFGIEAGRAAIVKQIVTVFKPYGVEVDYRHLYLIADYLTFPGIIKAMNRNWMHESVSPFLKMSFETSVNFLTAAASHRELDRCKTPSSQIVLGQAPSIGTGVFDIFMDMAFKA